jgi:hypothetical protein
LSASGPPLKEFLAHRAPDAAFSVKLFNGFVLFGQSILVRQKARCMDASTLSSSRVASCLAVIAGLRIANRQRRNDPAQY